MNYKYYNCNYSILHLHLLNQDVHATYILHESPLLSCYCSCTTYMPLTKPFQYLDKLLQCYLLNLHPLHSQPKIKKKKKRKKKNLKLIFLFEEIRLKIVKKNLFLATKINSNYSFREHSHYFRCQAQPISTHMNTSSAIFPSGGGGGRDQCAFRR
ncbi:hypothetical protein PIB30_009194 [Stylosanthes scabra]|uniref:Uncharacterized protein n=1 Tax=Stylosanthes scabra TaxID=79078 RepID=A0ABU6Z2T9_9FABA|nr:hypothetical protein [Stylosanthes scabra]